MAHLSFFGHWKWFSGAPSTDRKVKMFQGRKKKGKNRIGTFLSTAGVPMTSAEVQTRPLTPFSSAAGGWWQVFRGVAVKVGGQVIMRTTLVVNSSSFLFGRKKKFSLKEQVISAAFVSTHLGPFSSQKKYFNLI